MPDAPRSMSQVRRLAVQRGEATGPEPIREQLAEQAWGVLVAAGMSTGDAIVTAHAVAQNLLSVVQAYAAQQAAEELRDAAHHLDDGDQQAIEVALGGAAYVHRVLCDRAAALDPTGDLR